MQFATEIIKDVDGLCSFFQDLSHTLYQPTWRALGVAATLSIESAQAQNEVDALLERYLPVVTSRLDSFFARLTALDLLMSERERQLCRSDIRARLQPFFLCSPFMRRAIDKPLGYAGDYLTVEMLYDNKGEGQSPMGQLLARYSLSAGPARAHRARLPWAHERLRERARARSSPEVLSFACGPERPLREYIAEGGDCSAIMLCDADERALRYAQAKIATLGRQLGRPPRVQSLRASALSLVKGELSLDAFRPNGEERGYDMILILGLLDYLPTRIAGRLVGTMSQLLTPGGECLITNAHTENPWRSLMEYIADWFVIHRNSSELLEIATAQSCLTPVALTTDSTGVNLFFIGQKTS